MFFFSLLSYYPPLGKEIAGTTDNVDSACAYKEYVSEIVEVLMYQVIFSS